ncbi:PaaX family transcriptional regulator [Nocardioides sp. KR10-350]|uniref:PaaX family transcriptional regulator n=1 Tax=Nocardioides cheoyonin TaxID=3156615 RepID=UPI0032B39B97
MTTAPATVTQATVLDDLDSRPGSTTSLLRTVVGSTVRAHGGWMSAAAFVALMETVEVPAGRTRTTLTRLKARGLLVPEARDGRAGYALSEGALRMLARGDRRIHHPRFMGEHDHWCLVSFSVPETNRDVRHQLRRRLSWIGCGTVAAGLWICPAYLAEEVQQIVADLGLDGRVTLFVVDRIHGVTDLSAAVAQWWDLDALRARHDEFLVAGAGAVDAYRRDPTPATAFRTWIRVLDAWRPIPYLDPGLPLAFLPADWPARRSIPLFLEVRDSVATAAGEYVDRVLGAGDTPM